MSATAAPVPPVTFTDAHRKTRPVRLNVGAGDLTMPADLWENTDLKPGPGIQRVFDAGRDRWPYTDETVVEVYSSHCFEHLADLTHAMRELQRVLVPGGHALIRVPYGTTTAAMGDPTHVRPLWPETFLAYTPGYRKQTRNPQHDVADGWPDGFLIEDLRLVLAQEWNGWRRWPRRPFLSWIARHLWDVVGEMWIRMHRLSPEDVRLLEQGKIRVELAGRILTFDETKDFDKNPLLCAVDEAAKAAGRPI